MISINRSSKITDEFRDVRFCKDCYYHTTVGLKHYCTALSTYNLVTGEIDKETLHICDFMRETKNLCGVNGDYFKPIY